MVKSNDSIIHFLVDHKDYNLKEKVEYPNGGCSYFFENGIDMVIIDDGICNVTNNGVFSYMLITDKQNTYMHDYKRLFRFLEYNQIEVDNYLNQTEMSLQFEGKPSTYNREDLSEVSPLEMRFEENFSNAYGIQSLKFLSREYGICDERGKNYFLDYFVRTYEDKFAIEENGVNYHHPQIIGEVRYREQLKKQNSCVLWGIKLFRFSSEDCSFENRIEDDIKRFLGSDPSKFIESGIRIDREVELLEAEELDYELYEHQKKILDSIQEKRDKGLKAFLVVLPTASGKSKIVEEDIKKYKTFEEDSRILILVPTKNVYSDWEKRIDDNLKEYKDSIDVSTYSYMARHYTEMPIDYYKYIVVDEAHHAVAPVLKRVIQYFDSDFLIGLTATDQRPDKKKLETVFGSYSSSLSLKDAMDKEIIAKANVYRIETNIDLSEVKFNGKDYVNADLEKRIRVSSRNELIVDVLKQYFSEGESSQRQGVIFCVNVNHANEMARLLNEANLSAASFTGQTKNAEKVMAKFKNKEIRFLCSCNMISEGWDYPELGLLVMARPTLSKVLYLQQIGRGLRRTSTKSNVIVIDVVDEYGAIIKACSMHSIFSNPYYVPFGDITRLDYEKGEMVVVDGICERIERIVEVDINSFEDKYGDYYSQEQLAREYFVSTGTISNWIKKGKIVPSVTYKFGSKKLYLFSPEVVEEYRKKLHIGIHDDSTIKSDFFAFIQGREYTLSYKMPFMIALINNMNSIGDANIDDVLNGYIDFYHNRIENNLTVDRSSCPYDEETIKDRKYICKSMLTNPFEKFERKRFMFYSKELGIISINHALLSQMDESDWKKVKEQMIQDLENYYSELV